MAGTLTVPFHSVSVKEDKDSKGVIRFYLEGFDPKDHTANASVTDKVLTVTAKKGVSNYEQEIPDLDVSNPTVKPKKGQIDVHVDKNSKFKLSDKVSKS